MKEEAKFARMLEWAVLLFIFGPFSFVYYGVFRDREMTVIAMFLPFMLGFAIGLFLFEMGCDSFTREVIKKADELKGRKESWLTDDEILELAKKQVKINKDRMIHNYVLYFILTIFACLIITILLGTKYILFCFSMEFGVFAALLLMWRLTRH